MAQDETAQQRLLRREKQARSLILRYRIHVAQWETRYGKHNPEWLPPAGAVELDAIADDWMREDSLAAPRPASPDGTAGA